MLSTCPATELGKLQDSIEPERLQERPAFVGTEKAAMAKVAKGDGAKNRETELNSINCKQATSNK